MECPLCVGDGGRLLWRGPRLRVIEVDDPDYPGYTRVVWNAHIAEMTDLIPAERAQIMQAVWLVESLQRRVLRPDKINLAAFGNKVPHLHWHVISRYQGDRHFPDAIWGAACVAPGSESIAWSEARQQATDNLDQYRRELAEALSQCTELA